MRKAPWGAFFLGLGFYLGIWSGQSIQHLQQLVSRETPQSLHKLAGVLLDQLIEDGDGVGLGILLAFGHGGEHGFIPHPHLVGEHRRSEEDQGLFHIKYLTSTVGVCPTGLEFHPKPERCNEHSQ